MSRKKSIVILGAGEQAQVVKNIFFLNGRNKLFFLDDSVKNNETIGPLLKVHELDSNRYDFFISFGDNDLRKKWFEILIRQGKNIINAVHPRSYIEPSVKIGRNVTVGANAYINISSVIGDDVIINTGCIIEHDNIIGNHSQLAPRVATGGKTIIKEEVFVGMGSIIIDHLVIGEKCTIGAGSVVVKNTEANCLYLGIPAKKIKKI